MFVVWLYGVGGGVLSVSNLASRLCLASSSLPQVLSLSHPLSPLSLLLLSHQNTNTRKTHSDKVMALRFAAPASSFLATASLDRTVRVYQ
jgi:WD40 repeat protein